MRPIRVKLIGDRRWRCLALAMSVSLKDGQLQLPVFAFLGFAPETGDDSRKAPNREHRTRSCLGGNFIFFLCRRTASSRQKEAFRIPPLPAAQSSSRRWTRDEQQSRVIYTKFRAKGDRRSEFFHLKFEEAKLLRGFPARPVALKRQKAYCLPPEARNPPGCPRAGLEAAH